MKPVNFAMVIALKKQGVRVSTFFRANDPLSPCWGRVRSMPNQMQRRNGRIQEGMLLLAGSLAQLTGTHHHRDLR